MPRPGRGQPSRVQAQELRRRRRYHRALAPPRGARRSAHSPRARLAGLAALAAASAAVTIACGSATSSAVAVPPPTRAGPTPTPTAVASTAEFPAQLLDLTNWKITLPVNAAGETTGRPLEILQPQLARFVSTPNFAVRGDAVQFRAPVNGVTTSGSSYPRSELREMANGGTTNAAWSTTTGTHTMMIEQAITAVPQAKRHVVAGQIHDGSDDVLTTRLEQPPL